MKMESADTPAQAAGLSTLPRQKKLMTMAGVFMAMFLSSLDHTIVGTAMPRIMADLGGFGQYTLISSVYIVASAIVMPITGRLTDMYGRKPFYVGGLIIFIASSVGCGFSHTLAQMVIWRAIKGLGGGIMMATGFTVIGDLFPPARRGRYIGIGSALFGLAAVVGPILGGIITDRFSWPWVFFINVPLGVVVVILFLIYFPYMRPDSKPHRIDFAGIITLILTVLSFMLALAWGGGRYPWFSVQIAVVMGFSLAMLAIFIWIEWHCQEPILPLSLFGNSIVVLCLAIIFLSGFGMYGSVIFIPLFFQGVLGVTATTSGSILTPMMLGVIGGSFISGNLMSRAGGHYKRQGYAGIAVMALGMWLLSRMDAGTSTTHGLINVALAGFGLGITLPLYTIALQNAVPYGLLGVATSSAPFFRLLGGACGLAIFGAVMRHRFALELRSGLSESLKAALPQDLLLNMANNPQVLVDPERQKQLEVALTQAASQVAGADLFQQLLQSLRHCLEAALSRTFFVALITVVIALVCHLFLKEIPLRARHTPSDMVG
ncbi:MAG: MDR family MFS transporter [Desulfobacteraceae bacterium]|nr:MDR family MFS transporter [Desulfobacteraceae bacterium]